MTTLSTAKAALQYVLVQAFAAGGSPMNAVPILLRSPFDILKDDPAVYIYENAGTNEMVGLGSVAQYQNPRLRIEVFAESLSDADALTEALRSAWITDMNCYPVANTAAQGYLRVTGGIKLLDIGAFTSKEWDTRGKVFRRYADVNIEFKG